MDSTALLPTGALALTFAARMHIPAQWITVSNPALQELVGTILLPARRLRHLSRLRDIFGPGYVPPSCKTEICKALGSSCMQHAPRSTATEPLHVANHQRKYTRTNSCTATTNPTTNAATLRRSRAVIVSPVPLIRPIAAQMASST